ncbi:molybdopterin-binding protein [Cohnella lubricantis]|uniref:Molybdopterin molybdenumtransferase n=1 Tax=Cohnella lubricantis TaxID=2163172 RepID=A0A841TDI7_9BACL|nr:molybdopterin-binding protein [Cohnella lubricantis]MBB6676521.1 molybdopterin-binding protein [Cohnella lubricantis]MBP2120513.1 molybdenum cofactor synthesis domain-containing protein [Cohnella lubricantis]
MTDSSSAASGVNEKRIGQSLLREVKVEDAVGLLLAHDLTQIVPGSFKGRLFRKGHRVEEADIPKLKDIGKEHLYVMELAPGDLHEDDAALRMALALGGPNTTRTEPHEGKVTLKSAMTGLVKINKDAVDRINSIGDIALATVTSGRVVHPGDAVAATRAIPLIVPEAKVAEVERIAEDYHRAEGARPIEIKPFRKLRAGLLTTGTEVYSGRIADKFGPAVSRKLQELGSEVAEQRFAPDDRQTIVNEILYFLDLGYDMILVSGGMSVDPDDRTPGAIADAGTDIVSYGTPMLPGSMLLFGYLRGVPIFGLPGCVMHDPYTSFDVLLPRVLAGETIVREDIVRMGYGGLHR